MDAAFGRDTHDALPNLAERNLAEGPEPVKRCSTCSAEKPLGEFYKNKTKKDGLDGRCKACEHARRAERYRANPQAAHASSSAWKRANPHRRRVWEQRPYAEEITGDPGDLTTDEWEEVLQFYRVERGEGLRARFFCAYCQRQFLRSDLSIDHVTPLSRGGRNTKSNVVPACISCNSSKCNRDVRPSLPGPHLAPRPTSFEVTNPEEDAPDGATVFAPDRGGWFTRCGNTWWPATPAEIDTVRDTQGDADAIKFP